MSYLFHQKGSLPTDEEQPSSSFRLDDHEAGQSKNEAVEVAGHEENDTFSSDEDEKETADSSHPRDDESVQLNSDDVVLVHSLLIKSAGSNKSLPALSPQDGNPPAPLTPEEIAFLRSSIQNQQGKDPYMDEWFDDPSMRRLNRDVFSFFLFDSSRKSLACAVVVSITQLTIFCIIAVDNVGGTFGVPAQVSSEVKAAGFFALIIAVLTQDDIRTSLSMWRDRYHDDVFMAAFNGASQKKWIISTSCRALTGILSLAVTLLLIVQSEDVLDLLLNFTAIEVVSQLDDAAFLLAEHHYLGREVRKDAAKVSTTTYQIKGDNGLRWFRKVTLLVIYLIMLITWFIAVKNELPSPPTSAPTQAPTTYASTCSESEVVIRVDILTDAFPTETSWALRYQDDVLNRAIASGGPYSRGRSLFTDQLCVDRTRCLEFVINDSGGNGICCSTETGNGRFTLFNAGEEVATGGNFNSSQTVFIGENCPCQICGNGFLPSSTDPGCIDASASVSVFNASDPLCPGVYNTAAVYCGCPSIEGDTFCRICGNESIGGDLIPNFSLNERDIFLDDLSCLEAEIDVNGPNATDTCLGRQELVDSLGICC
jgi:hypothetical protein